MVLWIDKVISVTQRIVVASYLTFLVICMPRRKVLFSCSSATILVVRQFLVLICTPLRNFLFSFSSCYKIGNKKFSTWSSWMSVTWLPHILAQKRQGCVSWLYYFLIANHGHWPFLCISFPLSLSKWAYYIQPYMQDHPPCPRLCWDIKLNHTRYTLCLAQIPWAHVYKIHPCNM